MVINNIIKNMTKSKENKLYYGVYEEVIQTVAEGFLGRKLTKAEMSMVVGVMFDDLALAVVIDEVISNSISHVMKKDKK